MSQGKTRSDHTFRMKRVAAWMLAAGAVLAGSVAIGQTTAPSERLQRLAGRASAKLNADAADLYRSADTTYLVGDLGRAAELYRQILAIAPNSIYTVRVTARLGDCAYESKAYDQAVEQYRRAAKLVVGATDLDEQSAGVRADFMIGQAYLIAKQYSQAFGSFRRFIDRHPEDTLVNRAYQAIGDAHMALEQYQQALDAYRMVGTVFHKASASHKRLTPGHRLYLRVNDADVNISDTPRSVFARITTSAGDEERVELRPLGLHNPVFVATIPTELGKPIRSGRLNEAFALQSEEKIRGMLTSGDKAQAAAGNHAKELAELQRQGAGSDPAGFEKKRTALVAEIERLNRQAVDERRRACSTIDNGYRDIEKLLAEWSPDQALASVRSRAASPTTTPTTRESSSQAAPDGKVDAAMAEALARPIGADTEELSAPDASRRGMTQAEIDRIRIEVANTPTELPMLDKRLTALSIWQRSLTRQFQRLEINGSDTITVEYFDEIGPDGPNDRANALRTDHVAIASDAQIAILTPDGTQAINQAVLGGDILLRVNDADRDQSDQRDKVAVVLCAVARQDDRLNELRSQTSAKSAAAQPDSREIPGLVAAPTSRPATTQPLVIDNMPSVTVTLSETGPHTGVFELPLLLTPAGVNLEGKALPLDPQKRLRMAYEDNLAVRNPDRFVLAGTIDCVEDRGGSVAAVRYRLTHLDLQARLARAVASGEIGKIYLQLGLESRGKAYLNTAQADCGEVSKLAGKSELGEEALYRSWQIYFYAGLLDESVAAANRLIQAYPLSEYCDDAMLAVGQASLELGKKANEEAIAAGKPATLNRDLQRAVNQLDAMVKKYASSPMAPEALFLIGQAKISAGQTGLDAFEQLAKSFPDSGFASRGLIQAADYYISIADYRRAQEYFGRVLVDYPDSPQRGEVLLRSGICQYKLGQNAEALQTFYQIAEDHSGTELAAQAKKYISTINQSRGESK